MSLLKFEFLNDDFIKKMRNNKRSIVLQSFKKTNIKRKHNLKQRKSKLKYIDNLILYNEKLKDSDKINYDKNTDCLGGAKFMMCNKDWPLCLYDHTYKNRCRSYFAYKTNCDNEFIDDYLIKIEPREKEDLKISEYNELLMERNKHYCLNKKFAEKIAKLLEHEGTIPEAFPSSLIELPTFDDNATITVMEAYVKHIVDLDLSEDEKELNIDIDENKGINNDDVKSNIESMKNSKENVLEYCSERAITENICISNIKQ